MKERVPNRSSASTEPYLSLSELREAVDTLQSELAARALRRLRQELRKEPSDLVSFGLQDPEVRAFVESERGYALMGLAGRATLDELLGLLEQALARAA